jgi:hypothetical protein
MCRWLVGDGAVAVAKNAGTKLWRIKLWVDIAFSFNYSICSHSFRPLALVVVVEGSI